jgi:nucleoid DNA-binding protein
MNRRDLIHQVSRNTGIIQTDVELVLNVLLETIQNQVSSGNSVRLQHFGIFSMKTRAARIGRNLKGGNYKHPEAIYLPACRVPHFKPTRTWNLN